MTKAHMLASVLLAATPVEAAPAVEVTVTPVRGTVYMIIGQGGNIAVSAGDDGVVIVDDQFAPLAPKIEAAVRTISAKPIRFVLNTHFHGDHTGGNEHFGRHAPVVAHENARRRLEAGARVGDEDVPPAPRGALPVVTFRDTVTLHVNGEEIRAIHFPDAHTDGDVVIWFTASNVVHMGDNFFNVRVPFIDVHNGGSAKGMVATARRVATMIDSDTKVIPGHGPLGDRASLLAFAAMLEESAGIVEREMKAGMTIRQMKEAKVLRRFEHWVTGGLTLDDLTEMLFADLSRNASK